MAKRPCGHQRLASCVLLLAGNAVLAQGESAPPAPLPPPPAELQAPLQGQPFRGQEKGVVRLGDTLLTIAQRYGITLQELLRLNPGLDTARLVVGTQIQLLPSSQRNPGMMLGQRPTVSEVSPQSESRLPSPGLPARFSVLGLRPTTSGGGGGTSDTMSEIYRRRSAGFRPFGLCSYEWSRWRMDSRGIRTTRYRCGDHDFSDHQWIAVDCSALKTSLRSSSGAWTRWSYPASDNDVRMVATLCGNTLDRVQKSQRGSQGLAIVPILVGVIQGPGGTATAIFQANGQSASAKTGEEIGRTGWILVLTSGDKALIRSGKQEVTVYAAGAFNDSFI